MDFFFKDNFLIPFLSTAVASFTILLLQFLNTYRANERKKIFAITYMADVCCRILISDLFLKKNTVIPHVEMSKRILKGDKNLLQTTFLADEFDVLTDEKFDYNLLADEYKELLGNEDINLVQCFEFLIYNTKNEATRRSFNNFVKENLKSQHEFLGKLQDKQGDILNIYWDYLDKLKHEMDREIFTIIDLFLPMLDDYIKKKRYIFFSNHSIEKTFRKIETTISDFKDFLPEEGFMKKIASGGGIQNVL